MHRNNMSKDVRLNSNKYLKSLALHGASPKAMQWKDYRSAALRYRAITANITLGNKSIVDIGCGRGDLLPYLYDKSDNFKYLGVDVNNKFIEIAKKRYEGHEFLVANPFEEGLKQKFDTVVLCGALNANKDGWLENRKHKIQKLYELANEAVVFNMAGGLAPIPNSRRVAYADAKEILEFCSSLTPKIILQTHYHPKDFTITMFK
jgi:SAM-dependent methyltransferase